jgi:hypothetical protein
MEREESVKSPELLGDLRMIEQRLNRYGDGMELTTRRASVSLHEFIEASFLQERFGHNFCSSAYIFYRVHSLTISLHSRSFLLFYCDIHDHRSGKGGLKKSDGDSRSRA